MLLAYDKELFHRVDATYTHDLMLPRQDTIYFKTGSDAELDALVKGGPKKEIVVDGHKYVLSK